MRYCRTNNAHSLPPRNSRARWARRGPLCTTPTSDVFVGALGHHLIKSPPPPIYFTLSLPVVWDILFPTCHPCSCKPSISRSPAPASPGHRLIVLGSSAPLSPSSPSSRLRPFRAASPFRPHPPLAAAFWYAAAAFGARPTSTDQSRGPRADRCPSETASSSDVARTGKVSQKQPCAARSLSFRAPGLMHTSPCPPSQTH